MPWVVVAALLMLVSGVPGLFTDRRSHGGERWACVTVALAALCGLIGVAQGLAVSGGARLVCSWTVPGGALAFNLDPLAALFLLPVFIVTPCAALFGLGYWAQREHPGTGRKFRLCFGVIGAAMIVLLTAANAILFLVAWEIMALASYFLITTEDDKPEARDAGFVYLVATHTGTLALFAMFVLLEQQSGSFLFPPAGSVVFGTAIFLLGLFGFGLKAGLMPLHIWLPGAHAAAPSHASALLSGLIIKTGIYGLVRLSSFCAAIPPWWGWTLLVAGAVSGVLGVAFAIAQHDIKRLLAYHSVENIGIIAMGLGLALLGRSYQLPALTVLGLAGALLHVVNHGLFKSLLFLCAGALIHATGSRDLDHYGGLLRRQPWTGCAFLVGAVAICGLPPLNGFVSEWLIYLGALRSLGGGGLGAQGAVLVAPALALVGALALACFVKVFGVAFLGAPRTAAAAQAHPAPLSMQLALGPLLLCCVWIGLLPVTLAPLLLSAVQAWAPLAGGVTLLAPLAPLRWVGACGWGLLLLIALGALWLRRRASAAPRDLPTWGCGYAAPGPRMQYTASSFADGLVGLSHFALRSERHGGAVTGLFAEPRAFHSRTVDSVLDRLLLPLLTLGARLCVWVRARVQNGLVAVYLLYVAATLLVLLLWTTF